MDAYSAWPRSSASEASEPSALGPASRSGGRDPLVLQSAQRACEDGLGDAGQRHAELERVLRGPAAGALLLGLVEHDVDERLAARRVRVLEHAGGDLDQERLELAAVPFVEARGDLRHLEPGTVAQQVVGLGDQLHVGVLDAVVDHLHVVARAVRADVGAARRAVDDRRDRLERLPHDLVVDLALAAGHDARALQRAFLTPGHADAHEADVPLRQRVEATLRVAEERIAAVDDDVARIEVREQLLDHRVDRVAGLDHAHQHARALQRADPFLHRRVTGDRAPRRRAPP